MILQLSRQIYSPEGGIDARSAANAIGRSRDLSAYDLLLRESLQNSWDARLPASDHIGFAIDSRTLSDAQEQVLRSRIFNELPPPGRKSAGLWQEASQGVEVLTISDTGTRGLGGPLRSDQSSDQQTRRDFVDFVRNLGRSSDKGLAGGTYGLGKGVLFDASRFGLIVVYTQTQTASGVEPRLIGIAGGDDAYNDGESRYTGRAWWGIVAEDKVVDPLLGPDARNLAEAVGMPVPAPDATGTTIMIISPERAASDTKSNPASALQQSALKWAWPLMLRTDGRPYVQFSFRRNGMDLQKIDPTYHEDFADFVQTYLACESAIGSPGSAGDTFTSVVPIQMRRPLKLLGQLAHQPAIRPPSDEYANSVALMRNPRMVVKYLDVQPDENGHPQVGVFIADNELDATFAQAEPVAHDDWVPQNLGKKSGANPVRVALRKISEVFAETSRRVEGENGPSGASGAARVASELGSLFPGFSGFGADNSPKASKPGKGPARASGPSVAEVGQPRLGILQGRVSVTYRFTISGSVNDESTSIRSKAEVVTESGGSERADSPLAASQPEFVGWFVGTQQVASSESMLLSPNLPADLEYSAVYTQPKQTAIRVTATLEKTSHGKD